MLIARRSFLSGILALGCGPAIVRAASIMPVKMMPQYLVDTTPGPFTMILPPLVEPADLHLELMRVTRQAYIPRVIVDIYTRTPLLNRLVGEGK